MKQGKILMVIQLSDYQQKEPVTYCGYSFEYIEEKLVVYHFYKVEKSGSKFCEVSTKADKTSHIESVCQQWKDHGMVPSSFHRLTSLEIK